MKKKHPTDKNKTKTLYFTMKSKHWTWCGKKLLHYVLAKKRKWILEQQQRQN